MAGTLSDAVALAGALICLLVGTSVGFEIKSVTTPVTMAESPFYDRETDTVIFVDVIGKQVLRYDPKNPSDLKSISFSQMTGRVTPAVPVKGTDKLLVGVGLDLHLVGVKWGEPGEKALITSDDVLARVERNTPGNRFNDGKADRAGRLWIGTMDDSRTSRSTASNRGQLFRFELHQDTEDGPYVETTRVLTGRGIPNGMVWTEDNRGYYLADSDTRLINWFEFLPAGKLANEEVAFSFDEYDIPGSPDGLTIDEDGNLWIACVHGGLVIKVDPQADAGKKLLLKIEMPATSVSAAEWGGPNRDILYVTTARYKLNETELARQPLAGSMFQITGLGTRGLPDLPSPAVSRSRICPHRRGTKRLSVSRHPRGFRKVLTDSPTPEEGKSHPQHQRYFWDKPKQRNE